MTHVTDSIMLFSSTLAGSFVNAALEGAALALVISLCLRLVPGIRPASRFLIWSAVLLATLALHFIPLSAQSTGASALRSNAFHLDTRWAVALMLLWGAITVTRLIRLVQSALYLRRIASVATPVNLEPAIKNLLSSGRSIASLHLSADVDRPSVVGLLHPRILIPEAIYASLSTVELEQIVTHEMEHIRRGDPWSNLLQKLALALFPLTPSILWIERQLCMERELACDDCVLSATSSHKAYAFCLTSLAEHSMLRRNISLALGAWGKRSELAQRIDRILYRPRTLGRATGYAVTGTVIAGLLGGAASLSRVPSLVSFSSVAPAASLAQTVAMPEGVTAQPVVKLSGKEQFHPVLVKAVMPASQTQPAQARGTTARKSMSRVNTHRTPRVNPAQQTPLMRTAFEQLPEPPSLTVTIYERPGSSYAAVPVGNGWLVIQL